MFLLIALSVIGCGPSPASRTESAVIHGDIGTLRQLLDEGLDPNHVFPGPNRGHRLVHTAAEYANLEALPLLVSRNADINVYDNLHGATPLMFSVDFGNSHGIADSQYLEVFQYLLSQGADLQARDRFGKDISWRIDKFTTHNPEYKKSLESAQKSLIPKTSESESGNQPEYP